MTALVTYMILAGYRYIAEGSERRRDRAAMGHYLHPDVLSQVLDSPEGLETRRRASSSRDLVRRYRELPPVARKRPSPKRWSRC